MKTKIRAALLGFILLLALSGITAFPLRMETKLLMNNRNLFPETLSNWIIKVYEAVEATPDVVLYGTDWLAFGHLVIALFFIPVYIDPIKHKINLVMGMIACVGVFPIAFICGNIRGIPFFHQLIDCSFGVFGFLFLYYILKKINKLKTTQHETDL